MHVNISNPKIKRVDTTFFDLASSDNIRIDEPSIRLYIANQRKFTNWSITIRAVIYIFDHTNVATNAVVKSFSKSEEKFGYWEIVNSDFYLLSSLTVERISWTSDATLATSAALSVVYDIVEVENT